MKVSEGEFRRSRRTRPTLIFPSPTLHSSLSFVSPEKVSYHSLESLVVFNPANQVLLRGKLSQLLVMF